MNNLTLIGMPSCGKSTIGVVIAKVLGYDFIDSDLLIQKSQGRLLWQIMEEDGIESFIRIEEEINSSIDATHSIISTGGSAVYSEKAMEHLRDISTVVYLKVDYDILEERLEDLVHRGVVLDPGETLYDLYKRRTPLYEKYAHITIDVGKMTVSNAVGAVLAKIPDRPRELK